MSLFLWPLLSQTWRRNASATLRPCAQIAAESAARWPDRQNRATLLLVLTSAITGIIAAVLSRFGIAPGPYLAIVWVVVKLLIVGGALLVGMLVTRRKTTLVKEAPAASPAGAASATAASLAGTPAPAAPIEPVQEGTPI